MKPGDNKGSQNFKNKLSEKEVLDIFVSSGITQEELARRYNVSQSTINHIIKQRTWKWLTDNCRK